MFFCKVDKSVTSCVSVPSSEVAHAINVKAKIKETHNLIDYILVSNKNLIQDCGVITTADIGSDHRLVRAKIRLDNKLLRLKRIKNCKQYKVNTATLKANESTFQLSLKNRFAALEDLITIENFTEIVMEEAEKMSSGSKKTAIVESDEDKTIKSLDNKRKLLFKKDSKTPQENIDYTELNKLVKNIRRTKARRKRKEHVQKELESGKGPRSANKKAQRKRSPA